MIRKEFLMAIAVSALLLGGCVDSSTGAAAKADMEAESGHKTEAKVEKKAEEKKVEEKKAEAPKAEAKKEEAPAPKAEEKAPATDSVNVTACAGCHGANFEKKAMGVSKIVKDMTKDEIVKALKGYKDGSYGASMKALMKGQAMPLDDAKIEAIANKFGK